MSTAEIELELPQGLSADEAKVLLAIKLYEVGSPLQWLRVNAITNHKLFRSLTRQRRNQHFSISCGSAAPL
jgi:hypothetical protein